jgi:hypothetical protein
VVRSAGDRRAALLKVALHARDAAGVEVLGFTSSGLPGAAGNRESFVRLGPRGHEGAIGDLEAAVREVEP